MILSKRKLKSSYYTLIKIVMIVNIALSVTAHNGHYIIQTLNLNY
jgi:hypothetical protein